MNTRLLIVILLALIPLNATHVSAICEAESLEWWEACNDTGSANTLPLNPLLLFVVFPVVSIGSIIGGVILITWRKRK